MRWALPLCVVVASCSRQPCEDETGRSGPTVRLDVSLETCNGKPIADAEVTTELRKKEPVLLDGSPSSDPNDDALTYAWKIVQQPEGSNVVLESPSGKTTIFTPVVGGGYIVSLTVNDGELDSAPKEIAIGIRNTPPVAVAGDDFASPVGAVASFDGSMSSDADGDVLIYSWSFEQRPAGSNATINLPNSPSPNFIVDVAGIYTLALRVSDGETESEPDFVRVGGGVTGVRPVARPGADVAAVLGRTVSLNGGRSSDPEGAALTYSWRMVSEPPASNPFPNQVALRNAETATASFVPVEAGIYVVELVVNDGFFDSTPGRVNVAVSYGTGGPGDICEVAGCRAETTCFEGTCVGTGDLRISLSWTVISDFDLHVLTPTGVEIFYGNAMDGGGELDVDDCVGNNCRSIGTHVENIVFADNPPAGEYQVWVVNFNGSQQGNFVVEISGSVRQTIQGTLPAQAGAPSQRTRVTVP